MMRLNSLRHYERCRVVRCLEARLIDSRLDGDDAVAAFLKLGADADDDRRQLRWLLVQQSKLVH